jgi:hypothetical protein
VTRLAERLVSRILLAGGALAVALMLAGLIGLERDAAHRAGPRDAPQASENRAAGGPTDVFVSLPQLGRALRRRPPSPAAVTAAGILVLLATPGVALVAALAAFAMAGDRWYTAIAAVLAAALLCGFFFNAGA